MAVEQRKADAAFRSEVGGNVGRRKLYAVGQSDSVYRAPMAFESLTTLKAAGKTIGAIREYFDGSAGGDESSFGLPDTKGPDAIPMAKIEGNFAGDADWN